MKLPIRYAILASGGGTTAAAIMDACMPGGPLHGLVEVVCLVASRYGIGAIDKADRRDVPTFALSDPIRHNQLLLGMELDEIFCLCQIDWYGQHGWLCHTPSEIIKCWPGINQHPVPTVFGGKGMYGLATHAAVLRFIELTGRQIETEAVAQFVAPTYDRGKLIFTWPVEVREDDTPESLQARVLPIEHLVQVAALARLIAYDGKPPTAMSHFTPQPDEEVVLAESVAWARERYPRG